MSERVNESLRRIREQFLLDCRAIAPDLACEIVQEVEGAPEAEDGQAPDLNLTRYVFSFEIRVIFKGEIHCFRDSISGVEMREGEDIGDINHYLWCIAMGAADQVANDWMVRTFSPELADQADSIEQEAKEIQNAIV